MIRLPDPDDQDRVIAAIRAANEGESYTVRLGLTMDHEDDLSELLVKGEWGQTGMPITLDATISGYLPTRLLDAHTRLFAEIDGVPVKQIGAHKTAFQISQDPYSTDLLASSAGSLAYGNDAIKLGEFTEYEDMAPHRIVADATRRLPYLQNRVHIEPIPGVRVSFSGSGEQPGFLAHEPVGEVLNRMGPDQTIGYHYRDTPQGGFVAWTPNPLSHGDDGIPDGRFRRFQSAQMPAWDLQRPMPPTVRYSHVRVFHQDQDGKVLYEVVEEIPYPPNVRRPQPLRNKDIPYEDSTDAGPDNARARAVREALYEARNTHIGTDLTLPAFDPLIETYDPLWVTDSYRNLDGAWEVSWAIRTMSYKHSYGSGSSQSGQSAGGQGTLVTQIAYTATMIEESRIQAPSLIVPSGIESRTSGTVEVPRPLYGVSGEDLYFDTGTPGVTTDGDDLIFDKTSPATVSGDDLIVSD